MIKAWKKIKKHWFSLLVMLVALGLITVAVSALITGYIWVGGRGHYTIYRLGENTGGFWFWVSMKAAFGVAFSLAGKKIYDFEKTIQ